jgi:hypothetical protein
LHKTGLAFILLIQKHSANQRKGIKNMATSSVLSNDFMEKTSEAFHRFQAEKIPFSALRLALPEHYKKDEAFDQVMKKHLRETDQVLSNDDNGYAILMQGTPFEAAVSASRRLVGSLLKLHKAELGNPNRRGLQASFEIIGCKKDSEDLCRTYLELNSPRRVAMEIRPVQREMQAYLDAARFAARNSSGTRCVNVNIKV